MGRISRNCRTSLRSEFGNTTKSNDYTSAADLTTHIHFYFFSKSCQLFSFSFYLSPGIVYQIKIQYIPFCSNRPMKTRLLIGPWNEGVQMVESGIERRKTVTVN